MRKVPELKDISVVFGSTDDLPKWEDIPAEFKKHGNPWEALASRWFFQGLPRDTEFHPKPGVDINKALRALHAVLNSFEPKHEHKMAGVAYLMAEWFEDIKITEKPL